MNTSPYPIYVISLKRTPERRLYMQRQLDALGLDYRFVDAVDKNDLKSQKSRAEIARQVGIDESTIEYAYTRNLHDHFACSLSHVKAYNLMVEHGDEAACILEDDTIISNDFPEILRAAQKMPWDILALAHRSKVTYLMMRSNLKILKNIEESLKIDYSLFPKLRKLKWYKRLLPPVATLPSQVDLDWRFIPKLEWWAVMLLSSSRIFDELSGYSIRAWIACRDAHKYLRKHCNSSPSNLAKARKYEIECKRICIACKVGALPVRSSQQTLYRNYDIAASAEMPPSGMGYLLTSTMANKCKAVVNSNPHNLIDRIPWFLHKKYDIRLRILTPPCIAPSLSYLKYSSREG